MRISKTIVSVQIVLFFSSSLISFRTNAQTKNQEAAVLFYNVGFGGITAGIGAWINKPKSDTWHKAFLRGLWQGSIGGLVNYTSKKTLHLVYQKENTFYAVPSRLLNAAGYSIIESAAQNRPFLRYWSIDYGPVRIDFSTVSREDLKVRLLPQTMYAMVMAGKSGKFDIGTSLLTGTMAYKIDQPVATSTPGFYFIGNSYGRAFTYLNDLSVSKYVIAHEMIHFYQYREYQIFNSWLNPLSKKIKSSVVNKIFSRYVYLDTPYFFPFYGLEGQKPSPFYYRNFYEFEAERFSTNRYVEVN